MPCLVSRSFAICFSYLQNQKYMHKSINPSPLREKTYICSAAQSFRLPCSTKTYSNSLFCIITVSYESNNVTVSFHSYAPGFALTLNNFNHGS